VTTQQKPTSVRRERKSQFVRILRTTPVKTVCPNFFVLAHANGCTFAPRCSYCYLKSSFGHLKGEHVFTNIDKMLGEVRRWIRKDNLESYVLNMGNLSDSLAFEDERSILPQLVGLFREEADGRPHALLLVTKGGTKESRTLFGMDPCPNVIISFSVNSPQAARKHERGAATVADRMKAAERLKAKGWRIRIRIDPMMLGYDYAWIIEKVRTLAPERVTLGSLRAEKNLYRHTRNGLFAELEKPEDHEGNHLALARYPLDKRLALYRQATKALKKMCPMGLCEETPHVWNALGLNTDAKSCNCGC